MEMPVKYGITVGHDNVEKAGLYLYSSYDRFEGCHKIPGHLWQLTLANYKDEFGNKFFLGRPRPHVTLQRRHKYKSQNIARVLAWTLERERLRQRSLTHSFIYNK
ncbi:uncharacterized protein [Chelonus insularis]|uniref:uncharacterized protein n=1 Tax=Chelonus insularis TaxID=460826 RepID=UPI00158CE670|nr:uncharacterized protein LOC118065028 [Chelonus insularis]